jgi:hypothetical protein
VQLLGNDKDKQRWVIKATSRLAEPPKLKYIRRLVMDAWETNSGGILVTQIGKRPLKTGAAVAVKGCVALIKLWQQGPPEAIQHSWASGIPVLLMDVANTWRTRSLSGMSCGPGSGFGVCAFIVQYSTLLVQVRWSARRDVLV